MKKIGVWEDFRIQITAKVITEFDFLSLEVSKFESMFYVADPQFTLRRLECKYLKELIKKTYNHLN